MTFLWRALGVELFKLKRTLALAMVVVAPLVVVTLQLLMYMARADTMLTADVNPWQLMQGALGLWSILMLPLFITLESALLAGLEHGNTQWKHLFALPVPRWSIYVAKLLTVTGLVGASLVVLVAGMQAAGFILHAYAPGMQSGSLLWVEIGRRIGFTFVASWMAIALHTWFSLRWQSFTASVGVGMTATVVGFIAANSDRLVPLYPWTLPINILREGAPLTGIMLYSAISALLIGVAGCWNIVRRDVV